MGGTGMKDVGGAVLAGSSPPFLGRERAAVDVDVGPERRSPRYHETCLALESVKESSAAVSKPRCVWLRVPIFKDLEKARRLPVRVEEQQAQQLAMNPPRSAGDGRQEIQLTAMVPIDLPVLGNLGCRLLVKTLVRLARVEELSVPVPVPRRSAPAVMPEAEVEHEVLSPIPKVAHQLEALEAAGAGPSWHLYLDMSSAWDFFSCRRPGSCQSSETARSSVGSQMA